MYKTVKCRVCKHRFNAKNKACNLCDSISPLYTDIRNNLGRGKQHMIESIDKFNITDTIYFHVKGVVMRNITDQCHEISLYRLSDKVVRVDGRARIKAPTWDKLLRSRLVDKSQQHPIRIANDILWPEIDTNQHPNP